MRLGQFGHGLLQYIYQFAPPLDQRGFCLALGISQTAESLFYSRLEFDKRIKSTFLSLYELESLLACRYFPVDYRVIKTLIKKHKTRWQYEASRLLKICEGVNPCPPYVRRELVSFAVRCSDLSQYFIAMVEIGWVNAQRDSLIVAFSGTGFLENDLCRLFNLPTNESWEPFLRFINKELQSSPLNRRLTTKAALHVVHLLRYSTSNSNHTPSLIRTDLSLIKSLDFHERLLVEAPEFVKVYPTDLLARVFATTRNSALFDDCFHIIIHNMDHLLSTTIRRAIFDLCVETERYDRILDMIRYRDGTSVLQHASNWQVLVNRLLQTDSVLSKSIEGVALLKQLQSFSSRNAESEHHEQRDKVDKIGDVLDDTTQVIHHGGRVVERGHRLIFEAKFVDC